MNDWADTGPQQDWANVGSQDDWAGTGTQDDWTVDKAEEPKPTGLVKPAREKGSREPAKRFEQPVDEDPTQSKKESKEKVEPYINPDRVQSGGQQRTKLTPEELTERMEKIRLKNAQIKERRQKIEQDKEAFSALMEKDNARAKRQAQVQAQVDITRDENAQRKLDRQSNRAWDQDKKVQKEKFPSRGRGGKKKRGSGRDEDHAYTNQEDALAGTLGSTTTEETWGKVDDWAADTKNALDDWAKEPSPSPDKKEEGQAENNNLPADDEWGASNAETWAD